MPIMLCGRPDWMGFSGEGRPQKGSGFHCASHDGRTRKTGLFRKTIRLTCVISCYILRVATMPADLIDRLNTYRLERKLSQVQLAERLGVTFQTVNRWLNRRVTPSQIQEYQIKKLVRLDNSKTRQFAKTIP